MAITRIIAAMLMVTLTTLSYAQKTISEGTIIYKITTQSDGKSSSVDPMIGATSIVYLKGSLSRTDMVSPLGKETTIYDEKNASGVILKEYSGQKLMITLTKENWASQNKKFERVAFEPSTETKSIGGYNCSKVTAKLQDGSLLVVYFTSAINVNNKDYNQIFKDLPGLPVQYEFEFGKMTFKYLLASIDFSPVPSSKFEIPKSGFRVITYDESRKERKEGP
jgi:GLPGLI family protein